MENQIPITFKDLNFLGDILKKLSSGQNLQKDDTSRLVQILSAFPSIETVLKLQLPVVEPISFEIFGEDHLQTWIRTFSSLPGKPWLTTSEIYSRDDQERLQKNGIVLVGRFYPTALHKELQRGAIQICLKTNRRAQFIVSTIDDALMFEELHLFNGNWIEAYEIMKKTLLKGWTLEKPSDADNPKI
ncbi:MAG TPA: hypothetical protein VD908_15800 [Cytophagales bacterium]|nr:hypothetical protein [Cytophagales bacterium]